jgi:hypothetical protein
MVGLTIANLMGGKGAKSLAAVLDDKRVKEREHSPRSSRLSRVSLDTGKRSSARSALTEVFAGEVIRETIKRQVYNIQWWEELKAKIEYTQRINADLSSFPKETRCAICTLPYGSCDHTRTDEYQKQQQSLREEIYRNKLDDEIGDVLDFLGDGVSVTAKVDEDDVNIKGAKWCDMEVRDSDFIGDTNVSLFSPEKRGWHSATAVGEFIVVFGGLHIKGKTPKVLLNATFDVSEVEVLNDIAVYDKLNHSWHKMSDLLKKEDQPPPRYGHIAIDLDDHRMLIFGGRGIGGTLLNDTWIYNVRMNTWEDISNCNQIHAASMDISQREDVKMGQDSSFIAYPSPRIFSACARQGSDVYMFGGTDGNDNMCDLWLFKENAGVLLHRVWEKVYVAGPPPSPRYGHKLVALNDTRSSIAVIGGCAVSPKSEIPGTENRLRNTVEMKRLFDSKNELQARYVAESRYADAAGDLLERDALLGAGLLSPTRADADYTFNGPNAMLIQNGIRYGNVGALRENFRRAADIACNTNVMESMTRTAELDLLEKYNEFQSTEIENARRAKHPTPDVDVTFLQTDEYVWVNQAYPHIRGAFPCSRMHFGCFTMGHYIFLLGGVRPTSIAQVPVDMDTVHLYALDLNVMEWLQVRPCESTEYLDSALAVAETDVIRAEKKCE